VLLTILFYLFAALAVVGSVIVVTNRNPVISAVSLVATLFSSAALFLLLWAQFVAVVQVLVYAGAIIVLFLFTLMLLNLHEDRLRFDATRPVLRTVGAVAVVLVMGVATFFFFRMAVADTHLAGAAAAKASGFGTVEGVAGLLFTDFLLPFELTSVLLLSAVLGVVVIAKRRVE